jgi:phytanoyl-CoA hydroxylase
MANLAPRRTGSVEPTLHAPTLSAAEIEQFHRDGYLRLGHVGTPQHIDALRDRIDAIMLGIVTVPNMLMQLCPSASDLPQFEEFGASQTRAFKGPTLKYRKIQDLDQDGVYHSYISLPLFEDACRHLCGDTGAETPGAAPVDVSIVRTMFFNKPANQGVTIDWQ